MLTIDWKERLNIDTADFLKNKLPKGDYDFEIIFIAYPERVNGKIPAEVITQVASNIVQQLGKKHEAYLPFYRALWNKKGAYGKLAFAQILSKLLNRKPSVYLPLLEEALSTATITEINALFDKIMLPLLRKYPEKYLNTVFQYSNSANLLLQKSALNLLIKLVKKREDLLPQILAYLSRQWLSPLGETVPYHITMLKTVSKLNPEYYLKIWQEYGFSRDPQIVELLCASITDFYPELEAPVEIWTKSGNARLKKAATAAQRTLNKKKGAQ
ncbi:MAG TPA: hypothetical protein PLL35_02960 [Candidatus Cloacimonas sp.]|nr:hypothetical protein [Candidatus Cloacimonas sp.]HQO17741.1 hypothetical protein [Candidatus Cloacimonas sp.]